MTLLKIIYDFLFVAPYENAVKEMDKVLNSTYPKNQFDFLDTDEKIIFTAKRH